MVKTSNESLRTIFVDLLKDIFGAENHLYITLPTLAKATHNKLLQETFKEYSIKKELQQLRLEKCFELFGTKPAGTSCTTVESLVNVALNAVETLESGNARDVALLSVTKKILNNQISSYGTLRIIATVLGDVSCAKFMELSKEEEVETDAQLTELAGEINNSLTI